MSRLPAPTRGIRVKKDKVTHMTKLRLRGQWLSELGFTFGAIVIAIPEPNAIVFELRNEGMEEYKDLVRYVRQNKFTLLQVKVATGQGRRFPCITVTGSCLDKAGFSPGDKLSASCEHGLIKLHKRI